MNYIDYLTKMRGFSPRTIDIYAKYAQLLEFHNRDYVALLSSLPPYAANTRRLIVASLKSYYKFLQDPRYLELSLPRREVKVKPYVNYATYQAYLEKLPTHPRRALQKRVITRLLFETGIRAHELLQIHKSDINHNQIKIYGKGRRERIVKVSEWLRTEIVTYSNLVEGDVLFNFGYKNLYKKVQTLDNKFMLSPHMFRRGYAKHCYDAGVPLFDISLSMGHASLDTTTDYIKRTSGDVDIFKIFN